MKVVISGVNLVEGGILSVLQDCIEAISKIQKTYDLDITVLLHSKTLIGDLSGKNGFHFIEYPEIKTSWFKRLRFEYIESKNISNKIEPHLWLSLHDMTPNVNCKFQVVYCHNPSPFYKLDKKLFFYDLTFSMFCLFYKYLYAINIKRNAYVVIQQDWIRKAFKKMYNVDSIVAYPTQKNQFKAEPENIDSLNINFDKVTFFYPSIPRVFKNFETVCEAAQVLNNKGIKNFEVILTLNGTENKYANEIYDRYKHINCLKFIGIQKRNIIQTLYARVNCLVFPSKLETWGLPLSEFKIFNKPILVSDLPYAHENIGNYDKVKFFNPLNAGQLADDMLAFIENKLVFDKPKPIKPGAPFFDSWDDLLPFLISQARKKNNIADPEGLVMDR